jgi:hypothetical protein
MIHAILLIGLKDREGRLSLKLLAGKVRFRKIIGSRHVNNVPHGGSLVFGVKIRVRSNLALGHGNI